MNLLFAEDIVNKKYFDIILLINAVTEKRFGDFITALLSKKDWLAELCTCYYRFREGNDCYWFESFEENEFFMPYEEFMEYVSLAVVRYLNNSTNEERKAQIRAIISDTIIADLIDNAPVKDEKKVPLVYGRQN